MSYKMTEEHKRKIADAVAKFYAEHPEKALERGRRFITHGITRGPWGHVQPRRYAIWEHAKSRAKKAGLTFDLKPTDIEIPETCPLLGIKLISGNKQSHGASPSLDRIIPSLGYVKSNTWIISYRANAIKQNATVEELEMLVRNLRKQVSGYSAMPA